MSQQQGTADLVDKRHNFAFLVGRWRLERQAWARWPRIHDVLESEATSNVRPILGGLGHTTTHSRRSSLSNTATPGHRLV